MHNAQKIKNDEICSSTYPLSASDQLSASPIPSHYILFPFLCAFPLSDSLESTNGPFGEYKCCSASKETAESSSTQALSCYPDMSQSTFSCFP